MSSLLNKMLNFVGWEGEEEAEEEDIEMREKEKEKFQQPQFLQSGVKKPQGKVVNIHANNQFKVVIMQPENINDAQEVCDHLKSKKPVVINLEDVEKDTAQRIVDFLSGSIYALDGNIQKVSTAIFLIAPNNVDIMGDFKDEIAGKSAFPWIK